MKPGDSYRSFGYKRLLHVGPIDACPLSTKDAAKAKQEEKRTPPAKETKEAAWGTQRRIWDPGHLA